MRPWTCCEEEKVLRSLIMLGITSKHFTFEKDNGLDVMWKIGR